MQRLRRITAALAGRNVTVFLLVLMVIFWSVGASVENGRASGRRSTAQKILDGPSGSDSGSTSFAIKHVFYHDLRDTTAAPYMIDISSLDTQIETQGQRQPVTLPSIRLSTRFELMSRPRGLLCDTPDSRNSVNPACATSSSDWLLEEVLSPNITDKETIVNLAKMTSDAYVLDPTQPDWFNTSQGFNRSDSFGWQTNGLRGHVFADETNQTVILAFKGTSAGFRDGWDNDDRLNDNLLFSCCCATQRPDPYWYGAVCSCRTDTFQCNSTCLTTELARKDRYYSTAMAVMANITTLYPHAQVWTTGHSMGGAIASLIGLTYSIPAITFEAPPEALPAARLGLAVPPGATRGAWHFGNTADPVYMGACNGYFSTCSVAGYAFESQCFTGRRCVYDTVGDKGWKMSIANHRINAVIKTVLEDYDQVASCDEQGDEECVDCFNWEYHDDPPP